MMMVMVMMMMMMMMMMMITDDGDGDGDDDDDDDDDDRHAFYECREIPKVQTIAFSRPNPWLIPVNIASLSGNDVPQTI